MSFSLAAMIAPADAAPGCEPANRFRDVSFPLYQQQSCEMVWQASSGDSAIVAGTAFASNINVHIEVLLFHGKKVIARCEYPRASEYGPPPGSCSTKQRVSLPTGALVKCVVVAYAGANLGGNMLHGTWTCRQSRS